jgi:hypothetical protein
MNKIIKYILPWFIWVFAISVVTFGTWVTITNLQQSITNGNTMDASWFNEVKNALDWTKMEWKMCTYAWWKISCINDIPAKDPLTTPAVQNFSKQNGTQNLWKHTFCSLTGMDNTMIRNFSNWWQYKWSCKVTTDWTNWTLVASERFLCTATCFWGTPSNSNPVANPNPSPGPGPWPSPDPTFPQFQQR